MYYDVECPYCGEPQEINHDDGYGYEEDELYSQLCEHCEMRFVFSSWTTRYYDVKKADCLNGGEHKWEEVKCYPKRGDWFRCTECGEEYKS